jgi:hypothetical protein
MYMYNTWRQMLARLIENELQWRPKKYLSVQMFYNDRFNEYEQKNVIKNQSEYIYQNTSNYYQL